MREIDHNITGKSEREFNLGILTIEELIYMFNKSDARLIEIINRAIENLKLLSNIEVEKLRNLWEYVRRHLSEPDEIKWRIFQELQNIFFPFFEDNSFNIGSESNINLKGKRFNGTEAGGSNRRIFPRGAPKSWS